ncbi:MAG TPA: NAD(P)/FAD-dependent oxidoreductase [Pirellulales bacterium]|jgi:geranylgeranyl reductase family protein|nr:NAD(P)/FAD-dependent oxidoreductase [Pirellulales bacterium]
MQRCDVLIVGGGPAGSTCAEKLRAVGADVVVIDKKVFPREKPCAGWITPHVIETLKLDVEAYRRDHVFQPLTGFRTGLMSGREVETHYGKAVSFGIRRYEFDRYLLERSGAECRLGEALAKLERAGDRWIVNGHLDAALVVGAGGHFCPIAQRLGARHDRAASVVAAQEVEFEASASDLAQGRIDPEIPELFFCDDLKGYGWCFRKGNFLNIGLGRVDSRELSRQMGEFCRLLQDRRKFRCEIPSRFRGHAYQLYERTPPKLIDDGAMLVGDAAGLAYPHSGEGIRPAVESGSMAAEVIAAAAGDFSASKLEPYRQRVLARYGEPRGQGPTDWLPAGWLHFFAARLMASSWFARKVVLDRWFLHAHEPASVS